MNTQNIISKFDALIRFFLYVLIFWLPYSNAVIEICMVASLILWLIKRSLIFIFDSRSDWNFRKHLLDFANAFKLRDSALNKPIYFFVLACVCSTLSSEFFEISLNGLISKTLEWFLLYFLSIEVFKTRKQIFVVFIVILITLTGTLTDGFIQYYITNKDIFNGHMIEPYSRVTAGFRTPNGLGGYLAVLIPFFLTLFQVIKKNIHRFLLSFFVGASLWMLVLTDSRGALLGVAFSTLFLFLILTTKENSKKYQTHITLGLIIITILVIPALSSYEQVEQRTFGRATADWRLSVWQESLPMVKDKLVLGHGLNTYMRLFQAYREDKRFNPTYAHNCFLQMLTEVGMFGLISFLWIFKNVFENSFKIYRSRHSSRSQSTIVVLLGILAGIFSYLIHSFFDTNFYSLQLSLLLWFSIGMIIVITNIIQKEESLE